MRSRLIVMFLSVFLMNNSTQCSYLSLLNRSLSESSKVIVAGGIAYGVADLLIRVFKKQNLYHGLKTISLTGVLSGVLIDSCSEEDEKAYFVKLLNDEGITGREAKKNYIQIL